MDKIEKQIWEKLGDVQDPELGISVRDLGLIYKVGVKKDVANIDMTLTTMGCPLFDVMRDDIVAKVGEINEIHTVNVDLTFDPPWSPDKMSLEAKAQLGQL
ncbi:metal-sulfur cluster assembly factor [Patescibacteria group bacterium]